ncbi:hypothetical protein [Methanohalophilus sp. DAL1]|nr:hypothetical protein [Methanohalophilus sp. DAL1]OBZ34670.1 MAG: hypothetical protein A9957_01875 [Methanohalophilus sp. DAL1]OBZ34968.1 MAG: hypothetical protein A9957_09165 [Methanohalophilus sp. DAL1]
MRVLLIAFIILTITTLPAMADTLTVDGSQGADYRSMQQAVNNATSGDTILVYPGNYTESVYINKKLTIISKSGNPADTIVNAAIISDRHHIETDDVFNVNADGVVISGFTSFFHSKSH